MAHVNPPRRIQPALSRMPMGPAAIAIPLGSALILVGAGMIAAWYFEVIGSSGEAPPWLVAWMGGLFAAGGWVVAGRALRHQTWKRKARSLGEPWRRDHPWSLHEAVDESRAGIRQHAVALALMGALLVPLNIAFVVSRGIVSDWYGWLPLTVVGLFDLLFLLSSAYLAYRTAQYLVFGRSRFLFEGGPPFRLGGEVRGHFKASRRLALADCTATLRGVYEYMLVQGEDRNHVAEVFFEESTPIQVDPSGTAHVCFTLPDDAPPTSLADPPTRYWELVVAAARPGVDFEAVFLLPVYAATD